MNDEDLENAINPRPKLFLLLGDCNNHSELWESHTTDKRGKMIKEILTNYKEIVLSNDLSPTYFNIANSNTSAIDLFLCSSNIATAIKWQTADTLHGSDRFPIILKIKSQNNNTQTHIPRWKF